MVVKSKVLLSMNYCCSLHHAMEIKMTDATKI